MQASIVVTAGSSGFGLGSARLLPEPGTGVVIMGQQAGEGHEGRLRGRVETLFRDVHTSGGDRSRPRHWVDMASAVFGM